MAKAVRAIVFIRSPGFIQERIIVRGIFRLNRFCRFDRLQAKKLPEKIDEGSLSPA